MHPYLNNYFRKLSILEGLSIKHISRLPSTILFLKAIYLITFMYILKQPISFVWLRFLVILGMLNLTLLTFNPLKKPYLWVILLGYFLFYLIRGYYGVANHHFVFLYIIFSLIIFSTFKRDREVRIRFHIRWLISSILFFSALHKLLSITYMNGSFFLFQMDTGIFLKPIKITSVEWSEAVKINVERYNSFKYVVPGSHLPIAMQDPIKNALFISKVSSWVAVIVELFAGLCIFLKPAHLASHIALLITIVGVFIFRLETGFLSLLAAMGLLLCNSYYLKMIYIILIMIFISLMAVELGLR